MDPVSLVTEIPDLVERCIQGYNFLKDVQNAPKACSELMEELDIARAMLAELQEHVNRVENKEKVRLSASLQNYKRTLDKLDSVLKVYRDPNFKFTLQTSFKWAWSGEKKIKALCDDLKQNSGNFQPLLIQIARDIGEMNKRQEEADAKKAAKELAERLQKVVKWLEPLNSQAKLQEVRERRQPETCEWLPSHDLFVSWYESSGSFLWLNGILGNGKTILASFVIDHLIKSVTSDEIVLFAFADFQDVRSTDVVILLRTLLAQLLDHCKPEDILNDQDFAELEKAMQQHPADPPKSLGYLVKLLGKASAPWKRVFIVIDALDECARNNRGESIAAVHKLPVASAGSKISVFVTSRREQDIIEILDGVPTISLVNESERVKDDIERFIKEKMKTHPPLVRLYEPVRTRIISTLLEKANGMFRLVDCQLQSLAKAKLEKDIDNILRNLPADLNSMYERILLSIKGEGQEASQIVQRTLWWLVGSHRQLHLAELMEAVMVEAGKDSPNMDLKPLSGEHLLEMCSSLVRYDAGTDILTLSHASVQDFLFSGHLIETAHHNYHIPSFLFLHQHTVCLISTYLHYKDFQNGPCTTEQQLLECLEQHPFLVYVVSNWDLHIVKMYETCLESEKPPDFDAFLTLLDDSEKSVLAQRLCRQVSYFGPKLRNTMRGSSSRLEWKSTLVTPFRLYGRENTNELCKDVGNFVCPRRCAGPSWLLTDRKLWQNHPWRDLPNTTSVGELDYMVYPLMSQGPVTLVRDLLRQLPQFKERPLFYFGTPLMISIFTGKLETVKMLLQEFRVDVKTRAQHYGCNYEVVSPIFLATKYGRVEVAELLLDYDPATVFPERFPERELEDGHSDIIIAAVNHGRADILQILVHHGVDINTRSSISGNTVLHVAVAYGHIDSVKVLVEAGCNISPRSKGKTPLDLALEQRFSDLVQYLLDQGASFDQCLPQNFEDLWWAVGEPWYPETRQYLVTSGGGPKAQQLSYPQVTITAFTEIGKEELSIEVPKQRSYTSQKPIISSALANTPCASLGVAELLNQLNTTLGTSYTLKNSSLSSILLTYISRNYDFGAAYGHLRPFWYSGNWSTIQNELRTREENDQKMRREALVGNRIVNPNMPPRRVWDLYSNRVVPQWVVSDKKPWAISHTWMDPGYRVQVDTPINAHEWPVPIHKHGSLDLVQIEMLNLGAEYIWLDVLCLRQHGKQENERLREEEWKTDIPTSGYVYHQTEMVVYYFCGLGGPLSLTMDDLDSPRFWLNRAWTLQEISRKWIIGGITGDGTVSTAQTVAERDYQAVLDRIYEQLRTLVDTVHADNVFDLLMHLRKRKADHAVDHVAALIFLLRFTAIATYDVTQSVEDLWLAVVNTMRTKHRGDMFFLYPGPGNEQAWRPSWNQVITERRLPTGKVSLYADVRRDDETNSDWYDGVCIEEGRIQGLDTDDPKGLLRRGKLVIKDDAGLLHSLEIVAAHPYAIPEDSYTLIASGQWISGARAPSTEIYWVAGRRLSEQKFEKVAVFMMTDVKEIQRLKKFGITKRSIRNYLV